MTGIHGYENLQYSVEALFRLFPMVAAPQSTIHLQESAICNNLLLNKMSPICFSSQLKKLRGKHKNNRQVIQLIKNYNDMNLVALWVILSLQQTRFQ